MEISSEDIANLSFSSEIIKQAVGKLKRGKSDGGSLVSDHVIEASQHSIPCTIIHSFLETWLHAHCI